MSRRAFTEGDERNAVQLMLKGWTAAQVADFVDTSVEEVLEWWAAAYPKAPYPESYKDDGFMSPLDEWDRKVTVITYVCPKCGLTIHWAAIDGPKPWRCPFCGGIVR